MPTLLPIIKHPNDVLRKKGAEIPVKEIPRYADLVKNMQKTMHDANGIGLAAPQVNISQQLTVINTKDGLLPLFNPVIKKKSIGKEEGEEGCLSIPGVFGIVKRHKAVTVHAFNLKGEKITIKAEGLFARVLQHEIDHLNGVLFIDRTKKISTGNDDDPTKNV